MPRNTINPDATERREGPLAAENGTVEPPDLFAAPVPVASLATLATQINAAHADAQAHASKAVERALAAGDLLNTVKAQLKHGEFGPWCKQHCPTISPRTIQDWMRVARELPVEIRSAAYLSLREALRIVSGDSAAEPEPEAAPMLTDDAHNSDLKTELFTSISSGDDRSAKPLLYPVESPEPQPVVIRRDPDPASLSPAPMLLVDQWAALTAAEKISVIQPMDSKSGFNRQENDSIEWAQWSWNPVTGCRANCSFCYARDIADRFYPQKFEPAFHPGRLLAPVRGKIPDSATNDVSFKNVFTCSMADLFGRWVPAEWIEAVLTQVSNNPQWNFLFLTKYPKRLTEFEFPSNAWMGTTVDCQARVKAAEDAFERITGGTKWLSIEPMLQPLTFTRLALFDWVVIGGASRSTRTPEWTPPFDWVVALHNQARAAGCRIYHKANLGLTAEMRLKEFPWIEPVEKVLPEPLRYLASLEAAP